VWREWAARFGETAWEKGTLGEMRGVAWQASHGAASQTGLTARLLGEIGWSLFNSLALSLRVAVGRELSSGETSEVLHAVLPAVRTILELWLATGRVSMNSRPRQGRLAAVWRAQDEARKAADRRLQAKGDLPRFEPGKRTTVGAAERCSLTPAQRCAINSLLCGQLPARVQAPPPSDIRLIADYSR
jgi:hypothetical protein